jgi:putative ABC transport system permease protein
MDWKVQIRSALGSTIDEDVLEELAQHAAATYASARAEGCDLAEAERRVAHQIHAWAANPALLRRRPRRDAVIEPPAGSASPLAAIAQDTRYAWRLLRRQPRYAALVVATMALGIAATTVLGSVAYGVLVKPLPWADAPRLVRLYETRQGGTRRFGPNMTNGTFLAWRDFQSSTLDSLAAWSARNAILWANGETQQLKVSGITPGLFDLLGVRPAIGRPFAAGDEMPERPFITIISHGLWQQRFGGRSDIIGQTLRLDGTTYTIVGVMPASFLFPDPETRAWLPFLIRPMKAPNRPGSQIQMFQALGRLREGSTAAQAASEGTARGRTVPDPGPVAMAVFGSNGPVDVTAIPMLQALVSDVKPAILILLVAVVLLLATATANVASLQLARATARRRELAVRAALGAARGRLVRQTLVENLLLGLLGGVAGLALAALMHRALPALLPADFPRLDDLAFDFKVQAFAIAVSLAAGLGCGLLPALQVARHDLVPALVEDSLAPVGGGLRSRTARARALIMAGQVAIACVLLVGALLLTRSFNRLMDAPLGYDPLNLVAARVILPDADYSPERRLQTLEQIGARTRATPGVTNVAYSTVMAFTPGEMLSSFPLRKRDGSQVPVQTGAREVSTGYFKTLGQRIVEGRDFTEEDTATSRRVVIVNREFARKYLEGRALGWTISGSGDQPQEPLIVGVADDTVRRNVTDAPQPEIYRPVTQSPIQSTIVNVIVRTGSDPRAIVPGLRSIVREAAPGAPMDSIQTMEDMVGSSLARPRMYAVLLGTFAAFALAIAGVGLFGVLSYSVALRAREIGVRMALGAQVRDIVGLIVGQSMAIAGAGLTAGLVASYWITGALQKFLYGVTPHDAVSFGAVAAVLLLVSVLASIVPARRAAGVDPVKVLRA